MDSDENWEGNRLKRVRWSCECERQDVLHAHSSCATAGGRGEYWATRSIGGRLNRQGLTINLHWQLQSARRLVQSATAEPIVSLCRAHYLSNYGTTVSDYTQAKGWQWGRVGALPTIVNPQAGYIIREGGARGPIMVWHMVVRELQISTRVSISQQQNREMYCIENSFHVEHVFCSS